MMKILITGIHGFVGSNLVRCLKQNHELYGLDIVSVNKDGIVATFDWDELDKLPSVDAIIHLAGKAHDTKNKSEAQAYFDINTGLTQRIFDYFLQSEIKKFIYFSSVKAAADSVENSPLTEDVVPRPVGPYGESKIRAEEYLISLLSEVDNKDKKTYILRPCMIHGPGNKGNLNLLYNVVKKGIPWPLGSFRNERSFCSIDNISYVVEQLIAKDTVESGIYHVGDDETLSTNQLIGLIGDSVGKNTMIWNLPQGLMNGVANVCGALRLPLNNERLKKLTESYVVSNEKIKRALNIEKMPVTAVDGMRKTLQSFR